MTSTKQRSCWPSIEPSPLATAAGVAAFGVLSRLAMVFIPRSQMGGIASNAEVAFGRSERSACGFRGDEPDVHDAAQLTSAFDPKKSQRIEKRHVRSLAKLRARRVPGIGQMNQRRVNPVG